jgi:hypothetical protein
MNPKQALQEILAIAVLSPSLSGYLAFHDAFIVRRPSGLFAHPGAFVYGIVAYLLIAWIAWAALRGPPARTTTRGTRSSAGSKTG